MAEGRVPISPEVPADLPPAIKGKEPSRGVEESDLGVEVPYTDYAQEHNHPYLVDHFKLGDKWSDPIGGFPEEIEVIENYVQDKIKSGEVANSITAIKSVLKDMEKFNNLTKEERPVVKLEVLANYVEFMMRNEQTKKNLRRYSGTR